MDTKYLDSLPGMLAYCTYRNAEDETENIWVGPFATRELARQFRDLYYNPMVVVTNDLPEKVLSPSFAARNLIV